MATDGRESGFSNEVSVVPSLFSDVSAGLTGVYRSSAAWGDYDNDGDLDILLTGYTGSAGISKVTRNDGSSFTDISAGLTEVYYSSVAWGDYDNDGDLDILLTGSIISKIYRNDGGSFTDISADLTGVQEGSAAWGDYDNDGDLDVLLTGYTGVYPSYQTSKIYRNDGGTFTDISAGLTGVRYGSVAWGDYDGDGDLDILLTGTSTGSSSGAVSKIYKNTNGSFSEISATSAPLTGVYWSAVAWGDYDSDGDLDVLITGYTGSGRISKVYRNDGGNFTDTAANLTGVSISSVAWGDYDNDGDLDILLAGYQGGSGASAQISKVYRNDAGNFTDIGAGLTLTGVGGYSSSTWGDYDNDGDLDILLVGDTGASNVYISKVYRNDSATANSAPSAPANLTSSVSGGEATLSWDKSTDDLTAQNALTYNLRVGSSTGGVDVVSPMADVSTAGTTAGLRRIPALGNVNHNTSWKIENLTDGTYRWSVQAVDHGLKGSPFATEASFSVDIAPAAPTGVAVTSGDQQITLSWNQNSESDLHRYRIFRDTSSPATTFIDSVVATSPPDTFYVDTGLTNGETYYYRITAVDSAGHESGYSSEASTVPGLKTAELLTGSTGSTSPGGSSGGYPLNTYYHDVKHQSLYLAGDLIEAGVPAGATIRGVEIKPSELPALDLNDFRVATTFTQVSTLDSFLTSTVRFGPDTVLASDFTVDVWKRFTLTSLEWDARDNLVVEFSHDNSAYSSGGGVYLRQAGTNRGRRGYSDSGAGNYPFNDNNMAVATDDQVTDLRIVYVEPAVLAPTEVVATPSHQRVTLSWGHSPSPGLSHYIVSRGTEATNLAVADSVVATDSTYADTGLTNGTTYYYRIKSRTTSGEYSPLGAVVSATPAYTGPVWWVATDGDNTNEGAETTPVADLSTALSKASAGDTLKVKPGTYSGPGNRGIDPGGKNVVIMSTDGPDTTILDADGFDRHFRFGSGEDATFELTGFTLQNGKKTDDHGGSIYITYFWNGSEYVPSSPTIQNCVITGNQVFDWYEGGAVYVYNSSPTFIGCTFENNDSEYAGGAISLQGSDSSPVFSGCTFIHNGAVSATEVYRTTYGGAVYIGEGQPGFTDCAFDSNLVQSGDSDTYGGAVYIYGFNNLDPVEPVRFTRCYFRGNSAAPNHYAYGGAIHTNSRAVFTNCVIAGNEANGGADYGDGYGGGISIDVWSQYDPSSGTYEYGEVTLVNSTLTGNAASFQVTGYSAYGGGIRLSNSSQNLTMFNTIIWGNSAEEDPSVFDSGASPVAGYNNIEEGDSYSWFSSSSIVVEPAFTDPGGGDYSLSQGSYCLGAGTSAFEGIDAPSDDILGNPRPDPADSNPDMGAYESPLSASPYPVKVTGLTASPGDQSVTLAWDANPEADIDYYIIYGSLTPGFVPAPRDSVDSTGETVYAATGLANRIPYYFRVAAVDTEGYHGAVSEEISATPNYTGPVWWVAADGDDGSAGSESSPFGSVQSALDAASPGDTIKIKAGRHTGSRNRDLFIDKSVVILSESGPGETTLDGESLGRHMVISNVSKDEFIKISGLRFVNGADSWSGGSMSIEWDQNDENGPAPVITNCIFADNTAGHEGGAVSINDSSPRFVNCVFRRNRTTGSTGGAVYVTGYYSSPEFLQCKIVTNSVVSTDWSAGGGVYIESGTASFESCVIDSNTASLNNSDNSGEGGGVYVSAGDYWTYEPVSFSRCTFRGNRVESDGWANGGGLAIYGRADIVNCLIAGNSVLGGRVNINGNGSGGGLFINLGQQYNPNTSISEYGEVTVVNSTVVDNISSDETGNNQSVAGGMDLGWDDYTVTMFNSIVAGNRADGTGLSNNVETGSFTGKNLDYNDIMGSAGESWVGPNTLDSPPLFADKTTADYSLSPFSPCIEAGTLSFNGIAAPSVDLTGKSRPLPPESNPDMGAYEQGSTIVVSLPQEQTIVPQDTVFDVILSARDYEGNAVEDGTSVDWRVIPDTTHVTVESADALTANGEAKIALQAAPDAPRGYEFRVGATVANLVKVRSGSFFVGEYVERIPPAPVNIFISPDNWSQNNDFTISWTNPSWDYGIVGAYYEIEGQGAVPIIQAGIDSIGDIQLASNGEFSIKVWLVDELDHDGQLNAAEVTAKWDNIRPGDFSVLSPSSGWHGEEFLRFEWEGTTDATSGLEAYELQVGGYNYTVHPDSTRYIVPDVLPEDDYACQIVAVDLAQNSTAASNAPFIQIDRAPPDISHTPVTTAMLNNDTSPVSAFADDARSGVQRVEFFYRRGGEVVWQGPYDMLVNPNQTIPGSQVTTAGVEYYLEAEDLAGNVSQSPTSGGFYSIIVTIPGAGQLSSERWPGGFPAGTSVSKYQLLSFPIIPDRNGPAEVLSDDLGPYDPLQWRFFTYLGGNYVEFQNIPSIDAGKAYFLITREQTIIIDTDEGKTVSTSEPFVVNVEAGAWNFIGNPFDFEIGLDRIFRDGGQSIENDPNVFTWNGEWTAPGSLQPWYGFIYKSPDATQLSITPRKGGRLLGRPRAGVPANEEATFLSEEKPAGGQGDEWLVDIIAENGGARDRLNRVGVNYAASDGFDRMDAFEPPMLPGGVSVRIPHRDWGDRSDSYTVDLRSPSKDGQFWDLEVAAGDVNHHVYLTFDGIDDIPEDFDVFVIDRTLGIAQNLRWKPDYLYDVASVNIVHEFRLLAGTRDFVQSNNAGVDLYPDAYSLGRNFPNPFNAQTSMIVSLKDNAFVDLVVYNLLGEEVARLADHEYRPAGYYNFIWSGRSRYGENVASGVYIVSGRMTSPKGKLLLTQSRKMMLVK
ncbi:MAG: FG-GAP-like repeat-containing protein [Fidelibacterota bacterium]